MTAVEFIEPLSHDEGVKNATDLFRATYGEEPAGVWVMTDSSFSMQSLSEILRITL